jgi:hypothetical protein
MHRPVHQVGHCRTLFSFRFELFRVERHAFPLNPLQSFSHLQAFFSFSRGLIVGTFFSGCSPEFLSDPSSQVMVSKFL